MTLTGEQFEEEYREKFKARDGEINQAEYLHAYMIKRPSYFPNDSRLEPEDKKVILCPSLKLRGCGLTPLRRVFELEGAKFVKSLDEADIGIHISEYLCDYGDDGYPAIISFLQNVRNRDDLSAVVITNGRLYSDFCCGKCPEDKFMHDLIMQGKKINHIPLGYPYNRGIPLV